MTSTLLLIGTLSRKCSPLPLDPVTSEIAYFKADRPHWWSETIRFLQPSSTLSFGGDPFYKVRWNTPSN